MSDPRIYDAICLFQGSETARGLVPLSGEPSFVDRYRNLGPRVVAKLWEYYNDDEIGFDDLGPAARDGSITAANVARRIGHNIRFNTRVNFSLASLSSTLVHEASHMVNDRPLVEEEMINRTLEVLYYRELLRGIKIQSRSLGRQETVRILPGQEAGLRDQDAHFQGKHLIDYVLSFDDYRRTLSADWIKQSKDWWGRIGNRWRQTRGYYLHFLSLEGSAADVNLILSIMESFTNRADFQFMMTEFRRVGGTETRLRDAVKMSLYSERTFRRAEAIQRQFGLDLRPPR